MSESQIRNRLARLVGETEALDLLETPSSHLGGKSPQSLMDAGDFQPVLRLIEGMELEEIARSKWMKPIMDHTPRHAPQRKVKRVLALLDQLDKPNRRFTTR